MIYHAINSPNALRWWAVHAPTLTPLAIDATSGTHIGITIYPPDLSPFRSHPQDFAGDAIAKLAYASVRSLLADKAPAAMRIRLAKKPPADLPEYLPVFNHEMEQPAIWRSQEPTMIIPAKPGEDYLLGAPSHWRTAADLSVEGWEYWWEDCQRAWDIFHAEVCAKS